MINDNDDILSMLVRPGTQKNDPLTKQKVAKLEDLPINFKCGVCGCKINRFDDTVVIAKTGILCFNCYN